jgi:hypothetical protein
VALNRLFMPRNSALYGSLVRLGRIGRYCCTIGILTVIMASWFYGVYRPLTTFFNSHNRSVTEKQALIERIVQLYQQSFDVESALQKLSFTSTNNTPHEQQAQKHMLTLLECLSAANLAIVSCTTEQQISKKLYTIQKARLILAGNLAQIVTVFTEMQKRDIPILCSHLVCTKTDANQCLMTLDVQVITHMPLKNPST